MRKHIEPLDGRTYCYIGDRDTHFGDAGLTRVSVPYAGESKDGAMTPSFMAVDANGRTIIGSVTKNNFTLRRVDAFGVNDDAFAASAAGLPQAIGEQTNQNRIDVALDSSNRIYVLNGTTVTRYRSNGQVDRAFGTKGRARLNQSIRLNPFVQTADLDIGAGGQVFVVGSNGLPGNDTTQMQVIRLTADGQTDTKFADNGLFVVPPPLVNASDFGRNAQGQVVHGMADGSVIFAGRGEYKTLDGGATFSYHAIQSVRLDKLGRLVRGYGSRGIVTASYIYNDAITSSNPQAVGIRSDGTVFVGDTYGTDNPDPENAGGEDTRIIAPSGSTGILSNPGISTTVHGQFFDSPNGGSYFVNSLGLWKLNADGTAYAVFNYGKPIGSITAAAVGNNGELITAETGGKKFDRYYNLARYFVTAGPAATFVPTALTTAVKSLTFTVSYDDPDGVNAASNRDILVTGLNYSAAATLASSTRDKTTGRLTATYTIWSTGKKFTSTNNGLYTVSLTGSSRGISDVEGNHASARAIGTLVINIA